MNVYQVTVGHVDPASGMVFLQEFAGDRGEQRPPVALAHEVVTVSLHVLDRHARLPQPRRSNFRVVV